MEAKKFSNIMTIIFFWIEDFIEINKTHHTHTKYTNLHRIKERKTYAIQY